MKVLVTGATSGLGRNAAEWLLAAGHQVHATGRDIAVGRQLAAQGASFTALDLTVAGDEQCEQLIVGHDIVWHCAAKSSPWGSREAFEQANTRVTEKLACAAGRCGVQRFIHISTPAVYFDFSHRHNVTEADISRRFANHYAASKFAAEQSIAAEVSAFPHTTYLILRPRGLFGPHDRVIVPRILAQLRRDKGVLRLPGGGSAYLDLTFVLNVVHAMDLASRQPGLPSGSIFNITNQQPQRLADMLHQLLNRQLGWQYAVKAVPYPLLSGVATGMELLAHVTRKEPMLTRYSVAAAYFDMTLDNSRAIEVLGYRPRYSLEQGIELTAQWLKQQGMSADG
ncbi:NAD-dependent epimerase/dehydratase family protein [Serratia liquefaciens]|uniref:NAD-dependent epimerase/dehydratase family protein n=1 Tax=Serratia liquefaciens TaxID=614 RepID=UPI0022B9AD18|nr:NAD(P)-dependent oxidoreductase [Serratia liquefaciens]